MATSGKVNLTVNIRATTPRILNMDSPNADERFREVLVKLWELHQRKGEDYGRDGDPYANIRQYERLGLQPWIQCVGDIMENLGRVESFIKNGSLNNDPLENSLLDIASYAIIAYILYNEQDIKNAKVSDTPTLDEDELRFGHQFGCHSGQCRGCLMID